MPVQRNRGSSRRQASEAPRPSRRPLSSRTDRTQYEHEHDSDEAFGPEDYAREAPEYHYVPWSAFPEPEDNPSDQENTAPVPQYSMTRPATSNGASQMHTGKAPHVGTNMEAPDWERPPLWDIAWMLLPNPSLPRNAPNFPYLTMHPSSPYYIPPEQPEAPSEPVPTPPISGPQRLGGRPLPMFTGRQGPGRHTLPRVEPLPHPIERILARQRRNRPRPRFPPDYVSPRLQSLLEMYPATPQTSSAARATDPPAAGTPETAAEQATETMSENATENNNDDDENLGGNPVRNRFIDRVRVPRPARRRPARRSATRPATRPAQATAASVPQPPHPNARPPHPLEYILARQNQRPLPPQSGSDSASDASQPASPRTQSRKRQRGHDEDGDGYTDDDEDEDIFSKMPKMSYDNKPTPLKLQFFR